MATNRVPAPATTKWSSRLTSFGMIRMIRKSIAIMRIHAFISTSYFMILAVLLWMFPEPASAAFLSESSITLSMNLKLNTRR